MIYIIGAESMLIRALVFLFLIVTSFSMQAASVNEKTVEYSFVTGPGSWVTDFTGYPKDGERTSELAFGWENVPYQSYPLLPKGTYLSGNNQNELFMFVKTPVTGLTPNTPYLINMMVTFAANIPESNANDRGMAPGDVAIKVGASTQEPKKELQNGIYILNVNKGKPNSNGSNAVIVGHLGNSKVSPNRPSYELKTVENKDVEQTLVASSDAEGKLWVFIGTDSIYKGVTKYYLSNVTVTLLVKERK